MNTGKVKVIVKHVFSALSYLASLVFLILKLCGVKIGIDGNEINSLIVAVGAAAGTIIEVIPFIIQTIKDKNFKEILAIVNEAVAAADEIEGLKGEDKKNRVLDAVEKILTERNIAFDRAAIDLLIEEAVKIRNSVIKPKQ